jgi:uncharacterized protein (TIGR00255 family)
MKSMTGYGSGSTAVSGGRINVELRAVNHRFLEVKMTLPRELLAWEENLRGLIAAQLSRGRVEVTLTRTGRPARSYTIVPNGDLVRAYRQALHHLQQDHGVNGDLDLSFLASRPDVFQITEKPQSVTAEVTAIKRALQQALKALQQQRKREGTFLQRDLRARIATLTKVRLTIKTRSATVQQMARAKLSERVANALQGMEIEQGRLVQEVATVLQKGDITEELVRLQSHLEALGTLLRAADPVGKRLDFLLQEIQREVNTIGAKADDAPTRHLVVDAKEEVEKLREQVQNIE